MGSTARSARPTDHDAPLAAGGGIAALALDALHDATAVIDPSGVIVVVNAAWERFRTVGGGDETACGVGADYLGACATAAARGCPEALPVYEAIRDVVAGQRDFFELEYPCDSPEETHWFLLRVTPLAAVGGAVVSHVDITRRKRAEAQLSERANRDALTGLLNRRALDAGDAGGTAVLFVDLDGFKSVNDSLGHATGDEVLVRAADRILHHTRPADRVARVGGDEFVVLLRHGAPLDEAERVARRIETALCAPYQIGPHLLSVGASIGIARSRPGEPLTETIARADTAMYAVKRDRRQRRGGLHSPTSCGPSGTGSSKAPATSS